MIKKGTIKQKYCQKLWKLIEKITISCNSVILISILILLKMVMWLARSCARLGQLKTRKGGMLTALGELNL